MNIKNDKILLDESLFTLNEAFSESMPKWLKTSLELDTTSDWGNYGRSKPYYDTSTQKSKAKNKYKPDIEHRAFANSWGQPRGFSGKNITNNTLFAALSELNLDLSKATFITAEVPKKFSDPRLQWPDGQYVGFLYLDNGDSRQVYAPGVNDSENSILPDRSGNYKTLRYVPRPEILSHAKAFCYVDMTDTNNLLGDKWDKRKEIRRNNVANRANTRLTQKDLGWGEKIDKSGYLIRPDKYKDKLSKLGLDGARTQAKIDEVYNAITNLFKDAAAALYDVDYITDKRTAVTLMSAINIQLSYATDYYNSMMSNVKDYANESSQMYKDRYTNYFRGNYESAKSHLKDAERILDKYITQEVDWDNPE